ncbi:HD-GYP domain-containing protein [Poriferisphaera sp. WC338]|uniref:HD-GYP domain-containing protein n=1 Tax=Poriferisphaera sp. WC338 TaxID=3425129 RepID=UPI003D81A0F5
MTERLQSVVRERMLETSDQVAGQLAEVISFLKLKDISAGSDGRKILEDLLDETDIPGEGYLGVIDRKSGELIGVERGRVTAEQMAEIREESLALSGEVTHEGDYSRSLALGYSARMMSGDFAVATRNVRGLDAEMVVFLNERSIQNQVAALMDQVQVAGLIVMVVLVAVSAGITLVIFGRYEHELDDVNQQLENKIRTRTKALIRSRDAVILGLAKLAESRDDETGEHLERIGSYVRILGEAMADEHGEVAGVSVDLLAQTSALHDIGKVGIPDSILLKKGKLTDSERKIIELHPGIGGDTLMAIKRKWGDDPFLVTASQIAFGHHEHWDGNGYPFGLKGEDIPLSARIVAVADVYDALRSERQYKAGMNHEEAAAYVRQQRGKHFDPQVVDAFFGSEDRIKQVSETLAPDADQI